MAWDVETTCGPEGWVVTSMAPFFSNMMCWLVGIAFERCWSELHAENTDMIEIRPFLGSDVRALTTLIALGYYSRIFERGFS